MIGRHLKHVVAAVALLAVLAGACSESAETFGTPAGMRSRINELCEESRSSIEAGNVAAIRELADRIDTEVSDVYDAAVETSSDLRRYADAIEAGEATDSQLARSMFFR